MDLTLSEDQKLLRDSVERMLAGTYDFDARRGWLEAEGWSRENWGRFAELGLLAAPLPEAHGGLGGGAVEVMLITEAFGGALVLEPYIPCVILGAGLVGAAGDDAQKAAIL
ncbi:MAG: acyl-CoA dehydrogenase family protein, partial [Hyphomonadaceae bacterium]|nr:acyl-CoA dehydrogenase family protein [Hyphomonadaceae bacterium]